MRLKEEGERKDEKIRASEVKIEELMGYTDSIDDKLRSIEGNLISLREDNRLKEERIGELEGRMEGSGVDISHISHISRRNRGEMGQLYGGGEDKVGKFMGEEGMGGWGNECLLWDQGQGGLMKKKNEETRVSLVGGG